ncbi:MAG: UTP--glucose-1-phosphate uridylyltransferase [Clostridia bacterium]
MSDKLTKAKEILKKYHQEHLLYFYDEISENQKEVLLDQIIKINFDEILNLYENSKQNTNLDMSKVSPLPHLEKNKFSKEELNTYIETGEKIIKSQSFAVITMAGGQGTRLGYKGPKGTYELYFESTNVKKSLFQIMCEDIKRANKKYSITIPWYIMTSEDNDKQTKDYFENHNFFEYPREKVKFFIQGKLPIIDINGKLILQEPYLIKTASNGNGNVFQSMKNHNIIEDLEDNNIKWISFGGIDNVLLKNVDPLFIGLTATGNYQIASKSIFKEKPLEKTAVYCKKFDKPAILDYDDIDIKLSVSKFENGMYKYREANMLSHLMSLDAVKKVSNVPLSYHRAFKKNAFVNEEGMKQVPDKPNSFKFENFIFDSFSFFDDMLLLRVDADEEFAPIKDFTGIYNPDTAKEKYEKYWNL